MIHCNHHCHHQHNHHYEVVNHIAQGVSEIQKKSNDSSEHCSPFSQPRHHHLTISIIVNIITISSIIIMMIIIMMMTMEPGC